MNRRVPAMSVVDAPEAPRLPGLEVGALLAAGDRHGVWAAVQCSTGRQVAVKTTWHDLVAPGRSLEREAQAQARFSWHPNVATVLDVVTAEGRVALVLEVAPGGSLAEAMRRRPLGPAQTLRLLREIGDALAVLHAERVVHLDVKPANVLVGGTGEAWLADFGSARSLDGDAGPVQVSPEYCAPEALDGLSPGLTADVFSLGRTAVAAVLGSDPSGLVSAAGRSAADRRAAELDCLVPEQLSRLLREMTSEDPDQRPTAAQVVERVTAIQSVLGIAPTSPVRSRGVRAVVAGAVAVALIAGALIVQRWDTPPATRDRAGLHGRYCRAYGAIFRSADEVMRQAASDTVAMATTRDVISHLVNDVPSEFATRFRIFADALDGESTLGQAARTATPVVGQLVVADFIGRLAGAPVIETGAVQLQRLPAALRDGAAAYERLITTGERWCGADTSALTNAKTELSSVIGRRLSEGGLEFFGDASTVEVFDDSVLPLAARAAPAWTTALMALYPEWFVNLLVTHSGSRRQLEEEGSEVLLRFLEVHPAAVSEIRAVDPNWGRRLGVLLAGDAARRDRYPLSAAALAAPAGGPRPGS